MSKRPTRVRAGAFAFLGLLGLAALSACSSHPAAKANAARSTPVGAKTSLAGDPVGLLASAPPTTAPATPSAAPSPTGPAVVPTQSAAPVAGLRARLAPDVYVSLTKPLTDAQTQKLMQATSATSLLKVSTGKVGIGQGSTIAIGVDPSSFRKFTPQGTAESNPLWQAVADGNVAVAHTVAAALGVQLGAETPVTPATAAASTFRVGALATTGLPGIGVVVDRRYDATLGLTPATGLIITATGHDPVVTAALVEQTLGKGVTATALRVPLTGTGRLTWVAPAVGPITSPFGYRTSPITGAKEFHGGIDIGAPLGAPIYAASAGSVLYAGPAEGFGNEVILSHAGGVSTVYGHMERILVTAGSPVSAGQPIALVGAEGDATGPHLHFEVHVNGQYTDPLQWLIDHGVKVQK